MKQSEINSWPPLPYDKWKDTLDTLHMFMQVAGKVKLELHPFINQWWNAAFYLTSSGLTTGLIPYNENAFDVNFDFINNKVVLHSTTNKSKVISLFPRTVADFYSEFMDCLKELNVSVSIDTLPTEFADPIRCDIDTIHCSYDKEYILNWWKILFRCSALFGSFRSNFRGKSSPVHFFWGSFDLNYTRFSGKAVTPPDYGGRIMQFAENEENFSCGFWPGDSRYPEAAFYAYLYPAPKGIENVSIKPEAASFNTALGEFILHYDDVLRSSTPEKLITEFLMSTYFESASLAGWDIKSMEGPVPEKLKKQK